MNATTIAYNSFALRQFINNNPTFSFVDLIPADFLDVVKAVSRSAWKPGFREGVFLIPLDGFQTAGVFTCIRPIQEGDVQQQVATARREGEDVVWASVGEKTWIPAVHVDVVVYSREALAEGGDNSTEADFEVVSINASPVAGEIPQHPVSVARNSVGATGGTQTTYPPEVWAQAVWFWAQHTGG